MMEWRHLMMFSADSISSISNRAVTNTLNGNLIMRFSQIAQANGHRNRPFHGVREMQDSPKAQPKT